MLHVDAVRVKLLLVVIVKHKLAVTDVGVEHKTSRAHHAAAIVPHRHRVIGRKRQPDNVPLMTAALVSTTTKAVLCTCVGVASRQEIEIASFDLRHWVFQLALAHVL